MSSVEKKQSLEKIEEVRESQGSQAEILPFPKPIRLASSPTPLRHEYLQKKAQIENEYGDLEEIRKKLGLSRRKICQLLLVDPSAWTRWTRSQEGAPPHIYQSLRWYLKLKEEGEKTPSETIVIEKESFKEPEPSLDPNKILPLLFETKMLQLSSAYEKQLLQISKEIQDLKFNLSTQERDSSHISQEIQRAVGEILEKKLQNLVPVSQPMRPAPTLDPRVEQLKYENHHYQNRVLELEKSLNQMKQDMAPLKRKPRKSYMSGVDEVGDSSAAVANKFMAATLVVLVFSALLYAFIQYA